MTNEKTMTMAEAVKCCLDGSATAGYLTQADLEALATRYFWIMKPEFTAPAGRPCIHLNADTADFRKFKRLDDGLHAICRGAGINEIRTVTSDMIHAGTLPDSAKEGDLLIVIKGAVSAEGGSMTKQASDGMIQECSEERAALDKVLSFLTGAAKAEVVIPLDAAEDRACIAEYPHRHWLIAEVLTAEAWQKAKVNLRLNGFSLAFAGAQALDAEQAETISRTTSARKAKEGDLLITVDCRRCIESDGEVYDPLDGPTRNAGEKNATLR